MYKKRKFALKSNSNKTILCGSGGQHYLVVNFLSLFTISKLIKQYFPCERLKKIYIYVKLIAIGERLNNKNNLTHQQTGKKINLFTSIFYSNYMITNLCN